MIANMPNLFKTSRLNNFNVNMELIYKNLFKIN
jgi:hypothetical protein